MTLEQSTGDGWDVDACSVEGLLADGILAPNDVRAVPQRLPLMSHAERRALIEKPFPILRMFRDWRYAGRSHGGTTIGEVVEGRETDWSLAERTYRQQFGAKKPSLNDYEGV